MRYILQVATAILILCLFSCREDFKFSPSSGNLEFSRDTVYLDTVFTNIGSSTYTLKVYNRSKTDIVIPSIKLGKGENSKYRLMVDGMSGKVFNNVELLAKDSMFVFIETTIDYSEYSNTDSNFLYTDKIEFDAGSRYQSVELVTLVQDAYFLYPKRNDNGQYEGLPIEGSEESIYGFILDENDPNNGNELIWNNQKPYVIYGYAAIPNNKTLEIQEGAKIHFHENSGIIATHNSSLKANGTIENPIIFEGNRLEPFFSEIPGQWGAIWLTSGSKEHQIKNSVIKNSTIGLYVQNCDLDLENVQIYNSTSFGIMAQSATINGKNIIINNAGQNALACTIGGNYNFTHSTIVNHWNRSHRSQPALLLDNTYQTNQGFVPLTANFKNCIIFGSNNIEMMINKAENTSFTYSFTNSLIKFIDTSNRYKNNADYNFDDATLYLDCIISKSFSTNKPEFTNPNQNKLTLKENSAAIGTANWQISSGTSDITGLPRINPSDMGAYNYQAIEENP